MRAEILAPSYLLSRGTLMSDDCVQRHWHRFRFPRSVRFREAKALLRLATIAVEGLCGDAAAHAVKCRIHCFANGIDVDVTTHAGRALACLFRTFVRREYGDGAIVEDRLTLPTLEAL